MNDIVRKKLIPVYYQYDPSCNEVAISGKEYTDVMDCYADGANGENGIVDSDKVGSEPYNYFYEINNAMWSIDCPECAEGIFEITGYTIQEVIQKMAKLGFEMIEDLN